MEAALLIDFGSTYTKVTVVDLEQEEIIGTATAGTTIETGIMEGLNEALFQLGWLEPPEGWNFKHKLACSSAAGGLKIMASGLVKELTAAAARQAALGAGAKVLQVFSYELTAQDLEDIEKTRPDIFLLAGGTDGGNRRMLLSNAEALTQLPFSMPVVVAGNRTVADEAADCLRRSHHPVIVADNVMPELNVLAVDSARKVIREIFLQNIVRAKGLDQAEALVEQVSMPTPAAVLSAARLLAEGWNGEPGWGELMIVDVGGATTDVHSVAQGSPSKAGVMLKGLPAPYVQRTVEGDLGLRYSVEGLYEAGQKALKDYLQWSSEKLEAYVTQWAENPWRLPKTEEEGRFDLALGQVAVKLAVDRHAGNVETVYTPFGPSYLQYGKDLTRLPVLIGTGGVLLHHPNPEEILQGALFNHLSPGCLKPVSPHLYLDQEYILAAMGLLAEVDPGCAFHILKKYIKPLDRKEKSDAFHAYNGSR